MKTNIVSILERDIRLQFVVTSIMNGGRRN